MAKLGYGGFGHHPSGKQFVYILPDTARTNQNFVAPAWNEKAGREVTTMFTPTRTTDLNSEMGKAEFARLDAQGIEVKSVIGRDVMNDLPTGRLIKNYGKLFDIGQSAEGWKRFSQEKYDAKIAQRLSKYSSGGGDMMQKASSRLLGGLT